MQNIKPYGGQLYQWDLGRKVVVTARHGHTVDEVNFLNPTGDAAFVLEPIKADDVTLAEIPNILLQTTQIIHAWVVSHTEDGKQTVCDCVLPIIPRQKPADYVYTETEVKTYESLEERIAALERGGGGVDAEAVKAIVAQVAVANSGHTPNKYLGTDEHGNVVETDGGATDEQVQGSVNKYLEDNPVKGVYVGEGKPPKGYNIRLNPKGRALVYNPVAKKEEMTAPVGVDAEGRLWTTPSGGATYEHWEGGAY